VIVLAVRGADAEGEALVAATAALARGELIIYPTDTLYALGGRALDRAALARVRVAKAREAGKALPVIAGDVAQASALTPGWPLAAARLAGAFWPGPLTLVVPAARSLPDELTAGLGSVAVRVPALALARALCLASGPLVSTSANAAGAPPPRTCLQAIAGVGPSAALALDAGEGSAQPSTIVDVTSETPRLVREGVVSWSQVQAVFLSAAPG
jgi:L-threonylcarbamoyladenylate synthase